MQERSGRPGKSPEHNALHRVLEHTLAELEFPVGRDELAARARNVPVTEQTEVPPDVYLRRLPERTYRSREEVLEAVDEHWATLEGVQRDRREG